MDSIIQFRRDTIMVLILGQYYWFLSEGIDIWAIMWVKLRSVPQMVSCCSFICPLTPGLNYGMSDKLYLSGLGHWVS